MHTSAYPGTITAHSIGRAEAGTIPAAKDRRKSVPHALRCKMRVAAFGRYPSTFSTTSTTTTSAATTTTFLAVISTCNAMTHRRRRISAEVGDLGFRVDGCLQPPLWSTPMPKVLEHCLLKKAIKIEIKSRGNT